MNAWRHVAAILIVAFGSASCDKLFSSKSKSTEKSDKDDESDEDDDTPKKKKKSKKDKEKDSDEETKPEKPAAVDASWVPFSDAAAGFEAKFFSTPKVERDQQEASGMKIATVNVTTTDAKRLFMAMSLDMTNVAQYDCAVGLKGMVTQSLGNMGCTSTEEKDKPLGVVPGKEVSFTCSGAGKPQRGQMRVFCDVRQLKKGRVLAYSAMTAYQSDWSAEETTAFLDSFKLVSPK